ncbi:M23 family metallopeptidase [Parathalassolituus penaei]|uniref:M23 family metallopeptidase n=1 Tax=Parathalassolituus penaei TaxID=2997323 RepID=A0A9X3EAE2_9GAMM|nr:M23 family metallopeptidase [Parathalassolituus penaei]MCY0963897.1 M23 family metallopeptidase [Parathalassolituus penaei]
MAGDNLTNLEFVVQLGRGVQLILLMLSVVGMASVSAEVTIYRYQDASGRWMFSDSKPKTGVRYYQMSYGASDSAKNTNPKSSNGSSTSRAFANIPRPEPGPILATEAVNGRSWLSVTNPFYAPIELQVSLDGQSQPFKRVVPAKSKQYVRELPAGIQYQYQWKIGDPGAISDDYIYQPPVLKDGIYSISQGFNGAFSHNRPGNRYAVDIPMPVGTAIVAARGGVVSQVVDAYGAGGGTQWLRSQMNYITILHSDGTFGVYAHLLAGSSQVKPGDVVAVGQLIAASGNSGYSTGPHLHFAVRRNAGLVLQSIPFRMKDASGQMVSLVKGGKFSVKRPALLSANP